VVTLAADGADLFAWAEGPGLVGYDAHLSLQLR
jgi:hypothetical protein